jgi:hypothetical protein
MESEFVDSIQVSPPKPQSRLAVCAIVSVIVAVFILTWAHAMRQPFVDDDWSYLNEVQQPGWWHAWYFWKPAAGLYRPMLFMWFGLLHSLFGLHPFAYHVAISVVAFIVGVLTWRIALFMDLNRGAIVAGAVVLLYPSVGYQISWIAAASSPIAVALGLGAILVAVNRPITVSRSVAAALLLLLGLLTREVVIVAPAVAVIVAWARPGGALKDALVRSIPLWTAGIGYLLIRVGSGAANSSGPYHQQINSHALVNLSSLIFQTDGLSGTALQLRYLESLALFCVLSAGFLLSLRRHSYVVIGGLVWYLVGLLPVVFLVNRPPAPYYIDFALPGLALAIGASCEFIVDRLPIRIALAAGLALLLALGFAGHIISDFKVNNDFAADIAETSRLVAQVERTHPTHPSGTELIVVHSSQVARDRQWVTSQGDLFRVVFHDPSLRVQISP